MYVCMYTHKDCLHSKPCVGASSKHSKGYLEPMYVLHVYTQRLLAFKRLSGTYVCLCVCAYVYMCTQTLIARKLTNFRPWLYVCIQIHTVCMYMHTYTKTGCIQSHGQSQQCIFKRILSTYVRMHVYVYMCVCVYIYIYKHTHVLIAIKSAHVLLRSLCPIYAVERIS